MEISDNYDLNVRPKDDGLQITDFRKGDFEWWYFDLHDQGSGCFLKIVLHIGTDPLRSKVFPQLALSINTPESNESYSWQFNFSELQADPLRCNISVGDNINIWSENNEITRYFIQIDIPHFKCNFRFKSELPGWKPEGYKTLHQSGKKKCEFYWVVPQPKAIVEGEFTFKNKTCPITGAIGYHDHNYLKVDRRDPLYLDALADKWYWGKCHAGRFTMIFTDVHFKHSQSQGIMVAENNKITNCLYSLAECSVKESAYDQTLQTGYPKSLIITSLDESFPFKAEFEFEKILDKKDLLEGVNPFLKFLIKKLIAKPVYYGIFCKVRVEIHNTCPEGYGNFESMVFRGK